jgi:5-methylcytosine-specific restriction endonuclease McrBC GTP-binding regulatory subunit McrB
VPEVKMSLDLGAGVKPERVTLGNNLLFVGTMNEDETTHTLSDKVLDRGNVITFPRPRYLYGRSQAPIASSRGKLDFETWRGWVVEPDDKEKGLEQGVRDDLNAALNSINLALAAVNRAIGHRVLQAIQNYVANHPRTRENWKLAFEDQLVQKVMPKLRGIELESVSGKSCLDGVDQVLKRFGAGLIEDFTRARTSDYGAFLWSSASYLEQEAART